MAIPEIFNPHLRRLRRDRAVENYAQHDFLRRYMVDELLDRLDSVKRDFRTVLDLNTADGLLSDALRARGTHVTSTDYSPKFAQHTKAILCDEDRLPFAEQSFDLVLCAGGLESLNDLPGALTLIRRSLKPDGLFMAAMIGAGSLPVLKQIMLSADMAVGDQVYARIHPQIDVRSAGDLLSRAGFALPVADSAPLSVRYPNIFKLMADLRGMGATNILQGRHSPLTRKWLNAAAQAFAGQADPDGKTAEIFEILCLTAWSPAPDQPKPARRGSGITSLANALRPPERKE